ncbi:MAG: fibronectin-binding autotransporter adhesin, partial [Verrucomicrobiota bacterium]
MNSLRRPTAFSRRFRAQASRAAACWSWRTAFLLPLLFFALIPKSGGAPFDFVWVGNAMNGQFNDPKNWRADGPVFDPPPHPGANAVLGNDLATPQTIIGNASCDLLLLGGLPGAELTMAGTINVLSLNAQSHVTFSQNVTASGGAGATGTVTFNGTVTGGAVSVLSVDPGSGMADTTTIFNQAVTATDHSRPSFLVAAQSGIPEAGVAFFAPGSSLDSGPMFIGYFSAGTLNLAPGVMAKATSGNPAIAAVTIGALDPAAPGFGLASLDGGAVLEAVGDTHIGVASTGILVVTAGAQVKTSGQAVIGMAPRGNGSVTLQDPGSKWKVDGNLIIGQAGDTNNVATAGIVVRSGAILEINGPQVIIGQESNSVGVLTLDGFASKLMGLGSTNVEIGRHGTGTLELLNGAQFDVASLVLGALNGGNGNVKVDGTQNGIPSTFDVRGSLTIGGVSGASGKIDITGGGQVVSRGIAIIGRDAGSVGMALLSGLGSTWNFMPGGVLGDLTVGKAGTGTLKI